MNSLIFSRLAHVCQQSHIHQTIRFATKKAGGSTKNGRDSVGKRLGVKKFGGEYVIAGNIIVRQRGRTVMAGEHTKLGRDYTLFALKPGYVQFTWDKIKKKQSISIVENNPNPPPYVKKERYQVNTLEIPEIDGLVLKVQAE